MTAIAGVLSRAQGEVLPLGTGARDELLPDHPALAKACAPEPIDWDEAVRVVGEVLGSERLGWRRTAPAVWDSKATRHSPADRPTNAERSG